MTARADLPSYVSRYLPPDVDVYDTPQIRWLRQMLANTWRQYPIVVLEGPSGSGKTTACGVIEAMFTRQARALGADSPVPPMPVHRLEILSGDTQRQVIAKMFMAVTGAPKPQGTRGDMEHLMQPALTSRPRIIILDEAQFRPEVLEVFRGLHGLAGTQWTWVISGVDITARMHEMLATRVQRTVLFHRLDNDLLPTLDHLHPVLARTPRWLLRRIDRTICRGNFRRWAQYLEACLPREDDAGLDEPAALFAWMTYRMDLAQPKPEGWDDHDDGRCHEDTDGVPA
jgi:hypothetical protein